MPATVELGFSDTSVEMQCRQLSGVEQIGRTSRFQVVAYADQPVESAAVLGQGCSLLLTTANSQRVVFGTVTRFGGVATAQEQTGRLYKLTIESSSVWLRYRKLTRVFQHLSIPDVILQVFEGGGWDPSRVVFELSQTHDPVEYLTQYAETDEQFVRRLCEREGLYFYFEATEDGETVVFVDDSSQVPLEAGPLTLVDDSALNTAGELLWNARYTRRRRPGRVHLRDYDPKNPSLPLEADAELGQDTEKEIEVYQAPGLFRSVSAGTTLAELRLKQLRADSARLSFSSNAVRLRPGMRFEIIAHGDIEGSVTGFAGEYLVHSLQHEFNSEADRYLLSVQSIPGSLPLLLRPETPRPTIHGLHSALVTGASGEEIHPDADGNIFIRFHWDRIGPTDETSSLPVRVAQPNTPGSMVIPRIGWEVFVAFEDGDPDHPYVVGKGYNAGHMPPFDLPKNKMVSALRTFSSPGGGTMNSIHFDDAAGSQHMAINAGFAKSVTVANNRMTQTANAETKSIGGSQSETIGANEDVSVTEMLAVSAASQSATVGGMQEIFVKGNFSITVDTEKVGVGGALIEKVGNPVAGLINLGTAAALAGASALGGRALGALSGGLGKALGGGLAGGVVGHLVNKAGGALIGMGANAALAPAANWARDQAGVPRPPTPPSPSPLSQLGTTLAGWVGAGPLVASVSGMSQRMPWEPPPAAEGSRAAGGGTASASDSSSAGGPGPGHRNEKVKGAYTEGIGGALGVTTPGNIKWQTTGASAITVGGSNTVKAGSYGEDVKGASTEKDGSYHVKAKEAAARNSLATLTTDIKGKLESNASGKYVCESKASMNIKVGGDLKLKGSHVTFKVGDSTVTASPGGVLIKASTIEIKGKTKQTGSSTH